MRYTFSSTSRLKSPFQFQVVWKTGKRTSIPEEPEASDKTISQTSNAIAKQLSQKAKGKGYMSLMTLISRKNELDHSRLGISISKKNVPRAVDRNYLKRSTREVFRLQQHRFEGYDIVLAAYKGIAALSRVEQRKRLEAVWDLFLKRFGVS